MKSEDIAETIANVEARIGSRFYGLENVTKGGPRIWAIAPRPPRRALAAISGAGKPLPPHMLRRWCAKRHAWRTIDLTTVRRVWYRDPKTKERIEILID